MFYSIIIDNSTNRILIEVLISRGVVLGAAVFGKKLAYVTSKVKSKKTLKSKINLILSQNVILMWL